MLRKWKKKCGLGHEYEFFAVLVHLRQPLFLHKILSHFDLQVHQVKTIIENFSTSICSPLLHSNI